MEVLFKMTSDLETERHLLCATVLQGCSEHVNVHAVRHDVALKCDGKFKQLCCFQML